MKKKLISLLVLTTVFLSTILGCVGCGNKEKDFEDELTSIRDAFVEEMADSSTNSSDEDSNKELTADEIIAQYTCSDEIKNAKITDGKFQILDKILVSGQTTYGELKDVLAIFEENDVLNRVTNYSCFPIVSGYDRSGDDEYATGEVMKVDCSVYNDKNRDYYLKCTLFFRKNADKTSSKDACYLNDYILIYATNDLITSDKLFSQNPDEIIYQVYWDPFTNLVCSEEFNNMSKDERCIAIEKLGFNPVESFENESSYPEDYSFKAEYIKDTSDSHDIDLQLRHGHAFMEFGLELNKMNDKISEIDISYRD